MKFGEGGGYPCALYNGLSETMDPYSVISDIDWCNVTILNETKYGSRHRH